VVRIDSRGGICVAQSSAWRSSLDPITGTHQEEVKTSCRQPAELRKQVRAFREYNQKSVAAAGAARKAREPYDNEVVKRWTAGRDHQNHFTQHDLSLTGGIRMSSAKMDCEL